MSAYIIVNIDIHDPAGYETYKQLAAPSITQYQGRYIVRGGAASNLEGTWQPKRVVVLEFPSSELAKAWWNSYEYAPAKKIRQVTATTDMIVVEGV